MPKQKHLDDHLKQLLPFRQASLNKILRSLQAGHCCRVLGPRYRYKSKLMRTAAATLQENDTHYTAYQSLADIRLNSEASFFADLYTRIQQSLLPTLSPHEQISPHSAFEFQQAFINLLKKSDRNLAVFIDDMEIAPPNLVALLLGALRAVFMIVSDKPGARFQAVVCGSLSLGQVALANASRFESISDLVLVDDLDEIESLALAHTLCREAGLVPTVKGLQALLAQTGGDLSLIRRISEICFAQMKKNRKKKVTPTCITEAINIFLTSQPESFVIETLRQIESNPSLLSCALQLLRRGKVPAAKLPITSNETPNVLDLCGAFSQVEDNCYKIKCELWSYILSNHLTPARVGGLYAIAGYWPQAIKYLGEAIEAGQPEVKPELFTAMINAMHASENSLLALGYLAQGLQAAYPGGNLLIYHRTASALELIYPRKRHKSASSIPLNNLDSHEVEALDGPDYSIVSSDSDSRLLFPLRSSSGSYAVGLVSLNRLQALPSPYQHREEILQLTALLHQAARAIETKDQVLELLNTAKERADKLKTLNSIMTRILHHRERSEETILHLILAGVTSSWGLEFNRAILFMFDDHRQQLVGRLAVGHLTREEAEADWQKFPHQNIEKLVEYLLTHQVEEKSLHKLTKYLAFSLESDQNNLVIEAFKTCEPVLSSQQPLVALPEDLVKIIERPSEFALIPLRAANQTLGVLYVDDKFTEQTITPVRFELLQTFINQAALALENARALATEKKQTNILAGLLNVEELVNDQITKSTPGLFNEIVRSACHLIEADSAVFYPLCSDSHQGRYIFEAEEVVSWGTKYPVNPKSKPRSEEGMAAWVIQKGLVFIHDVKMAIPAPDGRKIANSPFISREKIQAFVGVRLGSIEEPVGLLYINWQVPRLFTKEELDIIQIYAKFATVAISSARRYQQVRADLLHRQERLETVARITSIITNASAELELDILRAVLSEVKRAIPQAHNVGIVQLDANKKSLFLLPVNLEFYQVDQPQTQGLYRVDVEQKRGIAGRVIQTGQVTIIPDVKMDQDYISLINLTRSAMAAPIKINGGTQAALILESNDLDAFSIDDKRLLEMLADYVTIALQGIQHFRRAHEQELRERTAMMATGLIHDIYSAVANIPDLVEELEDKMQSDEDFTQPLADLRKAAFDTDRVSSRLKNFVITGQFEPSLVDLDSLIQRAINVSKKYEPVHVKTLYTKNDLKLQIWADALWIELLLKNLLVNAYDAIPIDTDGVVNIEAAKVENQALIRVCDNGKGIASELIPNIFDFGFTTKIGNKFQGIGLHHCRQIVTVHNGSLNVISNPGIKTVFTVSLPLDPPHS